MKRIIPALLTVLFILPLKAQERTFSTIPPSPSVIGRISLTAPKIIAEFAPSDHFTLTTGFWVRATIWNDDQDGGSVYQPHFSPSFAFEPRYYFNLEERDRKEKRTDYYSGWYIGVPFNIGFPDLRYSMGGVIGFQCTLGKRWYWSISLGPGITYASSHFFLDGAGDFGLGIILNKM